MEDLDLQEFYQAWTGMDDQTGEEESAARALVDLERVAQAQEFFSALEHYFLESEDSTTIAQFWDRWCSSMADVHEWLDEAFARCTSWDPCYKDLLNLSAELLRAIASLVKANRRYKFGGKSWLLSSLVLDTVYFLASQMVYDFLIALDLYDTLLQDEEVKDVDISENVESIIGHLCDEVVGCSADENRIVRALLQQVYHHALHDRLHDGRRLWCTTSLSTRAERQPVATQVLCNRTVAQLGMCAFRLGQLEEARHWLRNLCEHQNSQELLGQSDCGGIAGATHSINININMVQVVYLICVVLIDAPRLYAWEAHHLHGKCRGESGLGTSSFRNQGLRSQVPSVAPSLMKLLFSFDRDRRAHTAPEDFQECILAMAKLLKTGDWVACWDMLGRGIGKSGTWSPQLQDEQWARLQERVKLASLQSYLLSASALYTSFSINHISSVFELERRLVRSAINRMIADAMLPATWDEMSEDLLLLLRQPAVGLAAAVAAVAAAEPSLASSGFAGAISTAGGKGALSVGEANWTTVNQSQMKEVSIISPPPGLLAPELVAEAVPEPSPTTKSEEAPASTPTAATAPERQLLSQDPARQKNQKVRRIGVVTATATPAAVVSAISKEKKETSASTREPRAHPKDEVSIIANKEEKKKKEEEEEDEEKDEDCDVAAAHVGYGGGGSGGRSGRNSRFRKDLTNLNRATAKWLHQGLEATELLRRIRASPVVQSLQASDQVAFDESAFIEALLNKIRKQ